MTNTRSDWPGTLTVTLPLASAAVSVPLAGNALTIPAFAGKPPAVTLAVPVP